MPLIYGARTDAQRKAISRGVKSGKLAKIYAGVYTDEVARDLSDVIRENIWEITACLFPGGVISHRTAIDPRPTSEGFFFVTYKRNRQIKLDGIVLVEIKGVGPKDGDHQVASLNIYQSQYERWLLENLQISKGSVAKSLGKEFVEQELYKRLLRGNANELNRARDRARVISKELSMEREFSILDGIIGALLATHSSNKLSTEIGKALAQGEPFDSERIKLLESLAVDLSKEGLAAFQTLRDKNAWFNFSFFEAYFSNYIEGTILTVEEARTVIETQKPLPLKRQDSHDVLGTFALINDRIEMRLVPKSAEHLIDILQKRHAILLYARADKNPGLFKQRNNQAGSYQFVDHRLVTGTIKKAFKYYEYLKDPISKAFYIMFLTAEVHPFEDGNGRIARIMMNAELTAADLSKIMIPSVYRTDYLGALRALSLRYNSIPYVRMLSRAFEFSSKLSHSRFEDMQQYLKECNAFETDEGSILRF